MDRRSFLKGSFSLAFAGSAAGCLSGKGTRPLPRCAAVEKMMNEGLFVVRPHLQLLERDAVGVCWLTRDAATGYVTWSQDGWKTERLAWSQCDGLRDSNTRVHRAVVAGFDPSRPVQWRAHSRAIAKFGGYRIEYAGEEQVAEGTIKSLAADPSRLSFAMVNDVHTSIANYPALMDCVREPVDFTVFAGDILNVTSSEETISRGLLAPMAYVSGRTGAPCWYLRGNHETRGDFSRRFRDYLMLKEGHYYGSVSMGPAHIVFLDTGEDKLDDHREYFGMTDFEGYLDEQVRWLTREVADEAWKRAKFRLVVQHIPAVPDRDLPRLQRLFAPLRDAGVHVMFAAHWHAHQWLEPDASRPFPVVVGGGSSLTHPNGVNLATLTRADIVGDELRIRQILAGSGETVLDRTLNG